MKCIVGLGNPGDQYARTKHNFGYWVIDSFLKKNDLQLKLGKNDYVFAKTDNFIIAKPTSFMNNSGYSIKMLVKDFNLDCSDLVIIYDDIDINLGTIRFRYGGSSGGHRGVDSAIYHLKSQNFVKLKLGIATKMKMRPSEGYVLEPFPTALQKKVKDVIDIACEGLDFWLENTINETMNNFNRRIKGES